MCSSWLLGKDWEGVWAKLSGGWVLPSLRLIGMEDALNLPWVENTVPNAVEFDHIVLNVFSREDDSVSNGDIMWKRHSRHLPPSLDAPAGELMRRECDYDPFINDCSITVNHLNHFRWLVWKLSDENPSIGWCKWR